MTGRRVVEQVLATGNEPIVLARSAGVDITSGIGLDEKLGGVDVVIDVSNVTTRDREVSVRFFTAATENLLAAEASAGVQHHVALSIVGIDGLDYPYYQGKQHQEELIWAAGRAATIVRATQFHEFSGQILQRAAPGPSVSVPRMRTQPIAVREVAQLLVAAAEGQHQGRTLHAAGPEILELPDMVSQLLAARSSQTRVEPFTLPGAAGEAMAAGALIPTPDGPRGSQTFSQWLASPDASPWL